MRTIAGICIGVCASLAVSLGAMAQMDVESPELLKKNLYDIGGGRHMNMVCIGEGSPTVVFDYGLSGHLLHWQKVQQRASAITRACFYDRAGYGYSDPSPRPMTAENVVDDLHALLNAAGITAPVLVGHSIGGLYAALYTDKYPDQVAGLVLVDPSNAERYRMPGILTLDEQKKIDTAQAEDIAGTRRCADLARAGQLTAEDPHGCFWFAPGRTLEEKAYLAVQFTKPFRYEAARSEDESFKNDSSGISIDSREEMAAARPWGSIPVIVLTHGTIEVDPDFSAKAEQAYYEFWKQGHDKLAARSTRGESIIVPNSTHFIQNDQPQAVIDAIKKVLMEVRSTH